MYRYIKKEARDTILFEYNKLMNPESITKEPSVEDTSNSAAKY